MQGTRGFAGPFSFCVGRTRVNRLAVAKELRIGEGKLRQWERAGLLVPFKLTTPEIYLDRVRLILAGRRILTMPRLRRALASGGC